MDTETEIPRTSDDDRPTTTIPTPKTTPTTTTAMTTSQPAVQDPPPPHHLPPGSPWPSSAEAASPEGKTPVTSVQGSAGITRDLPPPPHQPPTLPGPAAAVPPTGPTAEPGRKASSSVAPIPHPHSFHGPAGGRAKSSGALPSSPLPLNHVAVMAASHNKLPTSKVKAIVTRMGRHTQSSAGKLGRWYKNESYVDNGSYSWRNMALFADYQKQMYTAFGTVKASCKK